VRALQLIANIRRYLALRKERRATREAAERLKDAAAARACRHFEASRGRAAMGGHVLAVGTDEIVVRVMYLTDHIPPDRAWFAVPRDGVGLPRELAWEDVAALEPGPWR